MCCYPATAMKSINYLLSAKSSSPPIGIVNVDWLAFSVHLLETAKERDAHAWLFDVPPGYSLVELPGTNIYRRRLIFYSRDGRKILTILCEPYSRIIDRSAALVEVANEFLYTGFAWIMDLLYDIHPCTFLCLSRLDVCCDFQASQRQLCLISDLSTNKAYVAGKRDGSAFFSFSSEDTGIERVPRCLSWGSKNSNIKWKVYNKSLEIFEFDATGGRVCNKPYIVNEWHHAGWDDTAVWRCEVSISPAAKFEFYGKRLGWSLCINGFDITDLFVSLYMTRFVCRLNQGHKDKTNDTRVHLLADLGQVQRVSRYLNPEPQELPVVEYASALNAAMLQLSKPEVLVNDTMRALWEDTAMRCVEIGHLEGYFLDKYKYPPTKIKEVNNNLLSAQYQSPK